MQPVDELMKIITLALEVGILLCLHLKFFVASWLQEDYSQVGAAQAD